MTGPGRALVHDPADVAALRQLAGAAAADGDPLRAIRLYVRAAMLHGDNALYHADVAPLFGRAAFQAGKLVEANRVAEGSRAASWLAGLANSVEINRLLALIRMVEGRDAEAWDLLAGLGETDGGMAVALRAVEQHRADYDFVGTVVIPAFKAEAYVTRALDSVAAAVACFRRETGRPDAQFHICVVDDGSPDGTAATVLGWGRAHPEVSLALIANNRNRGAGRARNAGAAAALGPYLWFLDADDYFLERHLLVTAQALDRQPDAGYVRTGMVFDAIDSDVHPGWRAASEQTWPCNLCVRRVCHDLTGGFPEESPFHPAVADDAAYSRVLGSLFSGLKVEERTAHYTLRPDNALDRQRHEMVRDPAEAKAARRADDRFIAIELLTARRLHALEGLRARPWDGPPIIGSAAPVTPPIDWRPWLERAHAARQAGQAERALAGFTAVLCAEPAHGEAWFNVALQVHLMGAAERAVAPARRAARLLPGEPAARINLAAALAAAGDWTAARDVARSVLALRPADRNILVLLGRAAQRTGDPAAAQRQLHRAVRVGGTQADVAADLALAAVAAGDAETARRQAQHAVLLGPGRYEAQSAWATAAEAAGDLPAALAGWQRAIHCNPGYGEAFTRRALLLLQRHWGPPPPPRPPQPHAAGRLAATSLGRNGRFGNQLLQYGFLSLYARRHGLQLEVPPWLGRHLFDADDPLPGPALPRLGETEADLAGSLGGTNPAVYAGRDIDGYFCGDTTPLAPFRAAFRALFRPGRHVAPLAAAVEARLRAAGDTVVALHLRRGDFGWGRFWIAPEDWYLQWLRQIWPGLTRPVLYIATDDAALLPAFAAFRPLSAADLGPPVPGAEFLTDFLALTAADLLAISNSSFSFAASMINPRLHGAVRPDPARQGLRSYDPWAEPVLLVR